MKKIKVKLQWNGKVSVYTITSLTNAGVISFKGSPLTVGMEILPQDVDQFARDRRWEVTIVA